MVLLALKTAALPAVGVPALLMMVSVPVPPTMKFGVAVLEVALYWRVTLAAELPKKTVLVETPKAPLGELDAPARMRVPAAMVVLPV